MPNIEMSPEIENEDFKEDLKDEALDRNENRFCGGASGCS